MDGMLHTRLALVQVLGKPGSVSCDSDHYWELAGYSRSRHFQAGEIAQFVKFLSCRHMDLSSDPQYLCQFPVGASTAAVQRVQEIGKQTMEEG